LLIVQGGSQRQLDPSKHTTGAGCASRDTASVLPRRSSAVVAGRAKCCLEQLELPAPDVTCTQPKPFRRLTDRAHRGDPAIEPATADPPRTARRHALDARAALVDR